MRKKAYGGVCVCEYGIKNIYKRCDPFKSESLLQRKGILCAQLLIIVSELSLYLLDQKDHALLNKIWNLHNICLLFVTYVVTLFSLHILLWSVMVVALCFICSFIKKFCFKTFGKVNFNLMFFFSRNINIFLTNSN